MVFGRGTDSDIDHNRLYVPAAGPLYTSLAPYAWPMLRIALGIILITHGYPKLFQGAAQGASRNFVAFGWAYPLAWAYFIGVVEFFGGVLLILGLFTRIVAAAIAIEMAVIAFAVLYPHWGWTNRGMEYALLMGLVALALFIRGAGSFSIDSRLRKEF